MTDAACQTIRYDIFMAGDIAAAKQVCRRYCWDRGFCVTVEPVDFIYTGGEEAGFRVGLINYPRFPSDAVSLETHADRLGAELAAQPCQHSYSIIGPEQTRWISRGYRDAK